MRLSALHLSAGVLAPRNPSRQWELALPRARFMKCLISKANVIRSACSCTNRCSRRPGSPVRGSSRVLSLQPQWKPRVFLLANLHPPRVTRSTLLATHRPSRRKDAPKYAWNKSLRSPLVRGLLQPRPAESDAQGQEDAKRVDDGLLIDHLVHCASASTTCSRACNGHVSATCYLAHRHPRDAHLDA